MAISDCTDALRSDRPKQLLLQRKGKLAGGYPVVPETILLFTSA